MITVPEAARRVGKDPETIRRWIRSGRLRARKVGTQHVIEERDLAPFEETDTELPLPERWRLLADGRPAPNATRAIRLSRIGR
jgi:excisionase family DNA binding protein